MTGVVQGRTVNGAKDVKPNQITVDGKCRGCADDCKDAGGRATQESKPRKIVFLPGKDNHGHP